MRSMTGYSKLSYQDDKYALNMELKSVNNKNLNLKIKLPYNLNFLEGAIRTEIASKVSRGSLDLKIEFSDLRDLGKLFDYDKEQSKGYMNVLLEMEKDFNEKFSNKMDILVRNLNVIKKNDFEIDEENNQIHAFATVKCKGKTGVEMEALHAVSVTLLTIYDMCKAIDKRMVMSDIHLEEKTGGKSGDFRFEEK